MKVQITKAASQIYWYNDYIDQIFEVVDKEDNYMLKEDADNLKAYERRLIAKDDCKIIESNDTPQSI
jgi:hypothetical protein